MIGNTVRKTICVKSFIEELECQGKLDNSTWHFLFLQVPICLETSSLGRNEFILKEVEERSSTTSYKRAWKRCTEHKRLIHDTYGNQCNHREEEQP